MQTKTTMMTASLVALALSPATSHAGQTGVTQASQQRGSVLSTAATPACAARLNAAARRGRAPVALRAACRVAGGPRVAGGIATMIPRPYRKG